jgi:ribosomal protein S1
VGDKIKTKIISVDPEEHRIGLSIKALTEKAEEKADKKEKKEEKKEEKSEE